MTRIPYIILFDGHCNLCNGTVKFVIKRDVAANFSFAALQSSVGQDLLRKFKMSTDTLGTFVLIQGDGYYVKSTAALRVVKELGGLWRLLYVFILVPRTIRDYLYSLLAKRRYRWFGRLETCMLPTPDIKRRFLEDEG